ncbi:MAG: hypothetical protein K2L67_04280 [Clostridia bacterium]|nr:hypothetical protein [Clostridia bacterium]
MEVTLGAGERLIKSWNYAKTKGGLKSEANLTVTDKRVISSAATKRSVVRDEIPVSAITGVSTSYCSNFSLLYVILGVICCLTVILLPLGLNFIRKGTGTSLSVYFDVSLPGNPFISTSSIKKRRKAKRVKVKVDRACAKQIAEELSTVIFVDLK